MYFVCSDVFREFFARNAEVFRDAPTEISGEQNLHYYSLFQEYLQLYENVLSRYIRSLDVSIEEFYSELAAVKSDPSIKDKKLIHFVNYLLACTDYPSFYKVMTRAAKKLGASDEVDSAADAKADAKGGESKSGGGGGGAAGAGSKAEGKAVSSETGDSKQYK